MNESSSDGEIVSINQLFELVETSNTTFLRTLYHVLRGHEERLQELEIRLGLRKETCGLFNDEEGNADVPF